MFKGAHFVLKASVCPFNRMTKTDANWVDKYFEEGNVEHIKNYWEGKAESENPFWEYLVDGRINFTNLDIQELCAKALLAGAWPKDTPLPPWVIRERDNAFCG
jgi:hypothetical protein